MSVALRAVVTQVVALSGATLLQAALGAKTARPNRSLKPTRYGSRRLAAPGIGGMLPSAAKRRLPSQAAQLERQAALSTFPPITMKVVFTKGHGKYDTMDLLRPDGTIESVQCPKQGIIPHDMVHFAIEHSLNARGFLRRVSEGESANYQMAPESESDSVERLVETLQGDAWSGGGSSEQEILDMYQVTCSARGCPTLPLTLEDVAAARRAVQALTDQWRVVPVQGALELQL